MKKMIILDRDGVINFDSKEYIKSPKEWQPLPGSLEAIAIFKNKGFIVTIATNQSGLGRNYFTKQTLDAIHQKLLDNVRLLGGEISEINYCPHLPEDNCDCRKPRPGLAIDIINKFQLDPNNDLIYFVGDSSRDLEAATAANCLPILVKTGNGLKTLNKLGPTTNVPAYSNLLEFAESLS